MSLAGLTPTQILASLTTAPSARWNEGQLRGRVQPGQMADLVVLNGDPEQDVKHFLRREMHHPGRSGDLQSPKPGKTTRRSAGNPSAASGRRWVTMA